MISRGRSARHRDSLDPGTRRQACPSVPESEGFGSPGARELPRPPVRLHVGRSRGMCRNRLTWSLFTLLFPLPLVACHKEAPGQAQAPGTAAAGSDSTDAGATKPLAVIRLDDSGAFGRQGDVEV